MEMPSSGSGAPRRETLTGLESQKQREGFERMLRNVVERTSSVPELLNELLIIQKEHSEVLNDSLQTLLHSAISELQTITMDMAVSPDNVDEARDNLLKRINQSSLKLDAYFEHNFPGDFGIRDHVRRLLNLERVDFELEINS